MAKRKDNDEDDDFDLFDGNDDNDDDMSINSNDPNDTSSPSGIDDKSTDSSSGSRRSRRRNSTKSILSKTKSAHKFKIILIFDNFFNKLIQNRNRLIYDITNKKDRKGEDIIPDMVYGITDTHQVVPILKIIILKKKLLDKKSDENTDKKKPQSAPDLFFMFFIEDSSGSNKYKVTEINFYQKGVPPDGFILKSNYIYELYHNFKGDTFTNSEEFYLIVKDRVPFSTKIKILNIFYKFDISKFKIKFTNVFIKENNTLSNSIGVSSNIENTATTANTANTANTAISTNTTTPVNSDSFSKIPIPTLQIKGDNETKFGTTTAIQINKDKDPYEVGRCIQDSMGQKYKITHIHLRKGISTDSNDNNLQLVRLPEEKETTLPHIKEIADYTHTRCTDDENGCLSFKFKDDMLSSLCSTKNPYKEKKIGNDTLEQILNKKNNKKCEKDAEILRKKCDILKQK